jgi:hypothetical protein
MAKHCLCRPSRSVLCASQGHEYPSPRSIFSHFQLAEKPALLIGMDVRGQLDSMIIDYGAHELQLRPMMRVTRVPAG